VVGFNRAVLDAACSTDLLEGVDAMAGDLAVADALQVRELVNWRPLSVSTV
jgi:hypothetical protein